MSKRGIFIDRNMHHHYEELWHENNTEAMVFFELSIAVKSHNQRKHRIIQSINRVIISGDNRNGLIKEDIRNPIDYISLALTTPLN